MPFQQQTGPAATRRGPCARRTAMRSAAGVVGKGTIRSLGVVAALLAALVLGASAGVERPGFFQSPLHVTPRPRGSLSGFGNSMLMAPDDLAVFSDGQETFI